MTVHSHFTLFNVFFQMTLELEEITKSREAILENLWQEFQNVLNGYVQRTEGFYSEYMDLKDRDDESTTIMRENCLEIERLSDQLAHLKLLDADATEKWDFKVNQLTKLRNELTEQLANRKKQVEQEIHDDEQRIKFVSVDSYKILKVSANARWVILLTFSNSKFRRRCRR